MQKSFGKKFWQENQDSKIKAGQVSFYKDLCQETNILEDRFRNLKKNGR